MNPTPSRLARLLAGLVARLAPRRARRTAGVVASALAVVVGVSACGGIPVTGPIVAGPAVGSVTEPVFEFTPRGPVPGADPRQILSGYMQALRAPISDYRIARQFLSRGLAETWSPETGVVIRLGGAEIVDVPPTTGEVALSYTFTSRATVDGLGRYREDSEPTSRTLTFEFTQENGEWRISAAPDGIVLSTAAFLETFSEVPLYFFDPTGRYLVPDIRWLAKRNSTPNAELRALMAGPDEWLRQSVVSQFPAGLTLGPGGVVIEGSRATVDFGGDANLLTPQRLGLMQEQIIATLGVAEAQLTAEGLPLVVERPEVSALIDPQPDGAVLIGTADGFGFGTSSDIVTIPGISEVVVELGATAVTVARDRASAAFRGADGSVYHLFSGQEPALIDDRPSLVAPSLDQFGYTWSAAGEVGGAIEAFSSDGSPTGLVVDGLPSESEIVSIAVSRDSTRLAVAARTAVGSQLFVFGIVRSAGVPVKVGQPLELPSSPGDITGAQWVDARSIVVTHELVAGPDSATITTVHHLPIGAPSADLNPLPGAAVVVGGRAGVTGIRAIADGMVFQRGGGGGWAETGMLAEFLGVQQ